jgi:hypothetical protein
MNFAKVFLATAILIVASISPIIANDQAPNTAENLKAEYFFPGDRNQVLEQELKHKTDYEVKLDLDSQGEVWSACGDSVNMRVKASMTARADGMANVDSLISQLPIIVGFCIKL